MPDIIHPDLMTALANFYPSVCTIQSKVDAADSFGQLTSTWSNLASHIAIACRIAPNTGDERETREQAFTRVTHRIALRGYYPSITDQMRVVSGGINYDIERVEHDGQSESTYLMVEQVS